jgi:hypothetical protein
VKDCAVVVAELGRRLSEHRSEGAGKGLVSLVPGVKGNLGNGLAGEAQAVCCALEPEATYMLLDRFADHSAEDPVKVER